MENRPIENPQTKLPQLMILKTIREKLALIGITPKLLAQSFPFDWNMLLTFLQISAGVSFIGMYIFLCAESFNDYTQSVFVGAGGSLVFFILLVFVLKVGKLFELINRLNEIANTCKFKI